MNEKLVLGARVVLGLLFIAFGLNYFVPFIPVPPSPEAGQAFLGALFVSGYMFPLIKVTEIVGGLLLLTGIATPLGLILLSPVVVNIVAYHIFLAPDPVMPILLLPLMIFLGWSYRGNFKNLFIKERMES